MCINFHSINYKAKPVYNKRTKSGARHTTQEQQEVREIPKGLRAVSFGMAGNKQTKMLKKSDLEVEGGTISTETYLEQARDPFGEGLYPAMIMKNAGNRIGLVCYRIKDGSQIFEIQSLWNNSQGRVKGIGKELVSQAIDLARSKGCKKIELTARQDKLIHPEPFYRSVFGFTPIDPTPQRLETIRGKENGLLYGSLPVRMELDITKPIIGGTPLSKLERLAIYRQNALLRGDPKLARIIGHELFILQNPMLADSGEKEEKKQKQKYILLSAQRKSNVITNPDEIPFVF